MSYHDRNSITSAVRPLSTISNIARDEQEARRERNEPSPPFNAQICSDISYLDLDAIRIGDPLGGAKEKQWLEFTIDLQDFVHFVHRGFIDELANFI